jgi:hypothetical protein
MADDVIDQDENISKMFLGKNANLSADEELALHIMHRFNIDRETLETMPAFEQHLSPLFSKVQEK